MKNFLKSLGNPWGFIVAFLLLAAVGACKYTESPTAPEPAADPAPPPPPPPTEEPTACAAPTTNNSSVTAQPPGTCSNSCLANYSVTTTSSIQRVLWSFPGAIVGSESEVPTGQTIYPAPGTYFWSNKICTSSALEDPTDACCRPASQSVTFRESPREPVASFTVSVDGLTVTVVDLASGDIDSYLLSFGDSFTTSIRGTQQHEYGSAGTFTITQQVSGAGGSDTFSQSVTVQ